MTGLRYHLLALAVVAIWGVTFVCTKVLIGAGMDPAAIFFCRFTLAYAGIWAYTLLTAILTLLYGRYGKGRFAESLEKIRLGWPLVGGTL